MPAPVLELDQCSRRFAGRDAVLPLTLAVARGEVLGLLGVNGAGKTTSLRMMAGVLTPSAGSVRILGHELAVEPALARRHVGYLPELAPLHAELTVAEFLAFCARLHGLARRAVAPSLDRVLERCGLGEVRRRIIATLSRGWRQRVGIAQAILHEPALIVLDEPAAGLDPVQALKLRQLVRELGCEHAVVLSTHALPDVSACCDRVAILHQGALRHLGRVADAGASSVRVGTRKPLAAADWSGLPGVASAAPLEGTNWRVALVAEADPAALAKALVERGVGLLEFHTDRASLESLFLDIAIGERAVAA